MMDGSFVLMDIAAAQLAFDRLGPRRSRRRAAAATHGARCHATPTRGIDAAWRRSRARLPAGLSGQRPARRGQQVERMLAAFHLNLTALSWVALVVGLFLVYNTVTISVIARREEIGTLRALGVTRRQVLVAVPRRSGGARAGRHGRSASRSARLLADAAVGITSATVSTLYIATAAATPSLTPATSALAFAHRLPAVAARRVAAGARSEPGAAHGGDSRQRPARVARRVSARGPRRSRWSCWRLPAASRSSGRSTAGRSSATSRHSRRSSARRCSCRRSSTGWRGCCGGRCVACSASKACSRTPTSPRRFRDCRSRSRRWRSACR